MAAPVVAADLGVLTNLDVCNTFGQRGLTVSSSTNCLTISGDVTYTLKWCDYDDDHVIIDTNAYSGDVDVFMGDGALDWESTAEFALTFAARSESDFGTARGVIILEGTHETVIEYLLIDDETNEVVIDDAYLSIGDSTVIMAGLKSTIALTGNDTSFTFQELFQEDEASGVGYNSDATGTSIGTAGAVIQITGNLGNGLSVRAALEDLDDDDGGTLIGVLQYKNDVINTHVTVLGNGMLTGKIEDWAIHSGITANFDDFSVRAAIAANNEGWWNVLGTARTEFDMFTLAVGADATSELEYGLAASVTAEVTETVTLNLGSRVFRESDDDLTIDMVFEGEIELSETITLVAGGGYIYESDDPVGITYGRASLVWEPGADFETELTSRVHSRPGSNTGYELSFSTTKSFQ